MVPPSGQAAMRYERMDEHMPTAFGDFATQQLQSTRLFLRNQEPRPGDLYLGVYDLANIREWEHYSFAKCPNTRDPC
jgi:hypothetical protein